MTVRAAMLALLLAAAPVAAATFAPPAGAQQAVTLSGDWQGAYISGDGQDLNTFTARLRQAGGTLTGTMVETNRIGDPGRALFLTSTIAGTVRGADVQFVKTYDGSGGVSHAVTYTGRLEAGGRRIRGVYEVQGVTGQFELAR